MQHLCVRKAPIDIATAQYCEVPESSSNAETSADIARKGNHLVASARDKLAHSLI